MDCWRPPWSSVAPRCAHTSPPHWVSCSRSWKRSDWRRKWHLVNRCAWLLRCSDSFVTAIFFNRLALWRSITIDSGYFDLFQMILVISIFFKWLWLFRSFSNDYGYYDLFQMITVITADSLTLNYVGTLQFLICIPCIFDKYHRNSPISKVYRECYPIRQSQFSQSRQFILQVPSIELFNLRVIMQRIPDGKCGRLKFAVH